MFYLYDEPLEIAQNFVIDNTSGSTTTPPPAGNTPAGAAEPEQEPGFFSSWGGLIVMYGAVFAAMYFLWIRPQNRKRKAAMEMQATIKVGDTIVTSGGLYGTIASLGDQDCLVEFGTNKGIKIPIRRSDILGVKEPVFTSTN